MKIEQTKKEKVFEPYSIVVETKEEHDFLYGFFQLNDGAKKRDSTGYDDVMDSDFENLLKHQNIIILSQE